MSRNAGGVLLSFAAIVSFLEKFTGKKKKNGFKEQPLSCCYNIDKRLVRLARPRTALR